LTVARSIPTVELSTTKAKGKEQKEALMMQNSRPLLLAQFPSSTQTSSVSFESLEPRTFLSAAVPTGMIFVAPSPAVVVPAATTATKPHAVINATPIAGNAPFTAVFDATQSTSPIGRPLHFTWNFGDGSAHEDGSIVTHTFSTNGLFHVTLTAADDQGHHSVAKVNIGVGTTGPLVTISSPTTQNTYRSGETIRLSGDATNAAGNVLPNRDFTWTVSLHANGKVTQLFHIRGKRITSFKVPQITSSDPNQFIEVTLDVATSAGQVGSQSVDLLPTTVNLTVESNVSGALVKVNGKLQATPDTLAAPPGLIVAVAAPATQVLGGVTWVFSRWSDGGARIHDIVVPAGGRFVVAIYRPI
jgi:PKD repeat protein